MRQEQLQNVIEGNVKVLEGLIWEHYGENEIKAHQTVGGNTFSYYLRTDGRLQVYRGASLLAEMTIAALVPLAEQAIVSAKEKALDELAACFAVVEPEPMDVTDDSWETYKHAKRQTVAAVASDDDIPF